MSRGERESHWLVMRRCLAVLRRIQRGPTDWRGLAAAAHDAERTDASPDALHRLLEKDLARLRDNLQIDVRFDHAVGGYVIDDADCPLIDFPDEQLAAFAWLGRTFQRGTPFHEEFRAILAWLRLWLPADRVRVLDRSWSPLELDLESADEEGMDRRVWADLYRAIRRHGVELDYVALEHLVSRRYRVDPYHLYLDPAESHYYLEAWCHWSREGGTEEDRLCWRTFRLDRMRNLTVLPDRVPAEPPRKRFEVSYRLAPEVARLGVSPIQHVEIDSVEPVSDGGAVVRGWTTSVFWTARELLAYGAACRVLGGEELLARVTDAVQRMAHAYAAPP